MKEHLETTGRQYQFFQLVRLLKTHYPLTADNGVRIHYRAVPSLSFQSAEVQVHKGDAPDSLDLETGFLGLYGPSSPLPAFYTEDLLDDTDEATVTRQFYDLFNHRAHELLIQAWEKYRLYLQIAPDASDNTTEQIVALARLGGKIGYPFRYVDRHRLMPLTGLLGFRSGSATVVERVLKYYFSQPKIHVEENLSRWVSIPEDQHSQLGDANSALGLDLVLGEAIQDFSSSFRIRISGLSMGVAEQFLPGGRSYLELCELVDYLIPIPMDVQLSLDVDSESIPAFCLGDPPIELGRNSVLGEVQDFSLRIETPSENRSQN